MTEIKFILDNLNNKYLLCVFYVPDTMLSDNISVKKSDKKFLGELEKTSIMGQAIQAYLENNSGSVQDNHSKKNITIK